MDSNLGLILVFLALLESCWAYTDCGTYYCNSGTCCGYQQCCTFIYATWYFWVIVLVVFILKVSCITCYVRHRRRRAAMHYVHMPAPVGVQNARLPSAVPSAAPSAYPYPYNQNTAPPAYFGGTLAQAQPNNYPPPTYQPPSTAIASAPPQEGTDSTVVKDTELLVV